MTRARAVLLLLLCAGAMWIVAGRSWTQDPLTGGVTVPGVAEAPVDQAGSSPALLSCAAIVAVCALLCAMLGRVGRWIVLVLSAASGLGCAWVGIDAAVGDASTTLWPMIGAAVGIITAGVSVWIAVAGASWTTSARYERSAAAGAPGEDPAGELDPTRAWDAQSRGEDLS